MTTNTEGITTEITNDYVLIKKDDEVLLQIIPDRDFIGVHQWGEDIKVFPRDKAEITVRTQMSNTYPDKLLYAVIEIKKES